MVSFDTTLYGPATILLGIEQAARRAGYAISIASLEVLDRPSMVGAIQRLEAQGVEGIVVIAPLKSTVVALGGLAARVPLVAVEGGPGESVPAVTIDQFAGAVMATRHLLELGHRNILHIAGPAGSLEADQRVLGWRTTLKAAGIQPLPFLRGDWSAASGYEAGRHLDKHPEVTAVFSGNDQMALGLIRVLKEAGRDVPGDLSVVGFDDCPEAAYYDPPLTTVWQDFTEAGRRCLQLLVALIENSESGRSITIEPQLVVRASTRRLRK